MSFTLKYQGIQVQAHTPPFTFRVTTKASDSFPPLGLGLNYAQAYLWFPHPQKKEKQERIEMTSSDSPWAAGVSSRASLFAPSTCCLHALHSPLAFLQLKLCSFLALGIGNSFQVLRVGFDERFTWERSTKSAPLKVGKALDSWAGLD